MKVSKKLIVPIMLCACGGLFMQAQELTIVQHKKKFGYADASGNIVIKPNYTIANAFENGRAKVQQGNKWGYIDASGKPVIAIQYDEIEQFNNGIARVKKGGKYGYIKEDGSIFIKPEYNFIGSINEEGYVWVAKGNDLSLSRKGLYHNDKLVLEPKYLTLGFYVPTDSVDYTNGCPITWQNGTPKNNEITENLATLSSSKLPVIWAVHKPYCTTVYNIEGVELGKTNSAAAVGMPKDGFMITRVYSKKKDREYYTYNYLNLDNKCKKLFKKDLVQTINKDDVYEGCTPFADGMAMCTNGNQSYLIDKQGSTVSEIYNVLRPMAGGNYISLRNNLYGLVSKSGSAIIEPSYASLAPANDSGDVLSAQDRESQKFGFISNNGQVVVPFRFTEAIAFCQNRGYVKENDYYGIVGLDGNYISKNRWKNIQPAVFGDYAWVVEDGKNKWSLLHITDDKLITDALYDTVSCFDEKGRSVVGIDGNGEFGVVSTDNKVVIPFRFSDEELVRRALMYIDENNKPFMQEIEAYRFNLYNNPRMKQFRLHESIPSNMWDY